MKLLVDTSVWSLALRRRASARPTAEESKLVNALRDAITDARVAMLGPVRQELLSGIKEPAQFEKLKRALQPFRDAAIETADYEEAARLYNLCRSRGVECGPVDILICAAAWRRNWDVLTTDPAMLRCMDVIRSR